MKNAPLEINAFIEHNFLTWHFFIDGERRIKNPDGAAAAVTHGGRAVRAARSSEQHLSESGSQQNEKKTMFFKDSRRLKKSKVTRKMFEPTQ